jgi:endoglucanase
MNHATKRSAGTALALAALAPAAAPAPAAALAASAGAAGTADGGVPAEVRVNQAGYPLASPKVAFVMLPHRAARVSYTVSGAHGTVFRGWSARDLGGWNRRYRAVYALGFTGLTRPGRYRVTVRADGETAASPAFAIAPAPVLCHRLVDNGIRYFTSERDGAGVVPTVLHRQPANLTDRRAFVYRDPRYGAHDNLLGTLHRIGGPVNVAGGWFDAGGGYEKFAYTASYADGVLLLAARDFPGQYARLAAEARFGLRWLQKLWRPAARVLYIQVGIGTGNASNTIQGDYNFWFLPQAEDHLNVRPGGHPGPGAYYVKYRPVLEAAPLGHQISPEFAGRFAADFALGAQLAARSAPRHARHLLGLARSVYATAKTRHVREIVTTFPHDSYPGSEWKSAMLWGAAEIALADEALGAPGRRVRADLAVAARWARAYLRQGHRPGGDTLNLYDNGALGEAELLQAMRQASGQA